MNLNELLVGCRTYRRFLQKPVDEAVIREALENARIGSSGANAQPLYYYAVTSPEMVKAMQPLVKWAAYLPSELGTPKDDEQPTAFIVVVKKAKAIPFSDVDVGIAVNTIALTAWSYGIGSCIMCAINIEKIRELFGIPFRHPIGLAPVLERQEELLDLCDSIGYSFTGIIPGETPLQTVAERLQERETPIIAAVELRPDGPTEEEAKQRMIHQFSLLYDFADFFVIDINRESGLSSLDDFSDWTELLDELLSLRLYYERYKPIVLRIAPGHEEEQLRRVLDFGLMYGFDGVVAPGLAKVRFCAE